MEINKKWQILIIIITVFLLSGCGSISNNSNLTNTSNKVSNNANKTGSTDVKNNSDKKDYINVKYLFRVRYPGNWAEAIESETQDGALLYYKDDNDVRVFADKAEDGYIESQRQQAETEDKKVSSFTSNEGLTGILITGESKGKKLMHVIYVSKGTHYDFYALVSQDFNKNNENNFSEIAKSIKLLQ